MVLSCHLAACSAQHVSARSNQAPLPISTSTHRAAALKPVHAPHTVSLLRDNSKNSRIHTRIAAQPQQQAPGPEGPLPGEVLEAMKAKITEALDAESVQISDAYGDGRHVSIDVVASSFEGKNSVKRQQAVYKAIWLELQDTVHAVDAMTTKTPAEAR